MKALPKRLLYPLLLIASSVVLSGCGGGSLTVNTNDDVDDGTCNAQHCSLREAIEKANSLTVKVVIKFNIGGGGVQTIHPTSALPALTVPMIIDGTSQPGYASGPLIEVEGDLAGAGMDGLQLEGGKITIKALAINTFGGNGIRMSGPGENHVVGCHIGTDVSGTGVKANALDGVYIVEGEKNVIGGTAGHDRNILSGNGGEGVTTLGARTSVIGNYIGVDAAGSAALPNGGAGVEVTGDWAVIGGASAPSGNVISGNAKAGVLFQSGASDGLILGNLIGTDSTGTIGIGNKWGVVISGNRNTIGGDAPEKRNVISANRFDGVSIAGPSSENRIQGNYIGTDIAGSAALGNQGGGIVVEGDENTIGGDAGTTGNVISANLGDGVVLRGMRNDVQGNRIGLDAAGTAALGNHGRGVLVQHDFNLVGGEDEGMRNIISDNWQDGVRIEAGSVLIYGNYIGTNLSGTAALGNHRHGISVTGGGSIQIGMGEPGGMNVVSGNGLAGISLEDSSSGVSIYGNRIGTDKAGTAALGNIKSGIVAGGTDHEIGATWDGAERNIISGNGGAGIAITDSADRIVIKNNYIGTDVTGMIALGNDLGIEVGNWTGTPDIDIGGAVIAANQANVISGNATDGILLYFGAGVWGNKIGTDATGSGALGNGGNGILVKGSGNQIGGEANGNTIAFNGGHGVAVISESGTATGNGINVNHIFDNGGLGIAIDGDAVIPNDSMDADAGDNGRQNYPSLMTVQVDYGAGTTRIIGKLTTKPNTEYMVEYFASPSCDPSGFGEGRTMIDMEMMTTDVQGYHVINNVFSDTDLAWGSYFTATATDPDRNTSEFSYCVQAMAVPTGIKAATETPAGMTFAPYLDPAGIFWGRCTPDTARISVEIANPPEPISYVLLFARLMDPKSGAKTDWSEGLSMLSGGKNIFFYDLSAYDMDDFNQFQDGVVQYQFVVYNKSQAVIGRSEVYGDLAFQACGKPAGVANTPTPHSPLVGPK